MKVPLYFPVTVVVLNGNEPPTPNENVPADPRVLERVCDPVAVAVVVTVNEFAPDVIEKVAGTAMEMV